MSSSDEDLQRTEQEQQVEQAQQEIVNRLNLEGASVDWFLQQLVGFVNEDEGNSIGLTLNVEGATISGELIGGRRYFTELAGLLKKAGASKDFSDWIGEFKASYRDPEADPVVAPPIIAYVHMREARIFSPSGAIPTGAGVLWRGKINAVSGFSFGTLSWDK